MHSPHLVAAVAAAQNADRLARARDERVAREVLAAKGRDRWAATAARPYRLRRARRRLAGLLVPDGCGETAAVS